MYTSADHSKERLFVPAGGLIGYVTIMLVESAVTLNEPLASSEAGCTLFFAGVANSPCAILYTVVAATPL